MIRLLYFAFLSWVEHTFKGASSRVYHKNR
jgi:hypothetical protein